MSQGFRHHGRRKCADSPGSLPARRLRAVLHSLLAKTGRELAEPKAHSASGGRAAAQVPRLTNSARKALTIARPTDGYGAGGLQDLEILCEFVFTAISKQTGQTTVTIIQCYQVGMDHGKTSQKTARPPTRCSPTQALFVSYGAIIGHLDQTVYLLP
jgi:hypothetical protein